MGDVIKINMYEPDEDVVIRASREIILGGIVIMPTDTIYGFHASPFCMDALNRIIKLKQMTEKKPFIMLIPSPKILKWLGIEFKRWQIEFLIRIWPGPVSVIMKSICSYPMPISDEGWICFRVPDNILVNNIIRRIGFSIISTSANISGFEPLKEPQVLIEKFLNNVELILDGGIVKDERPSTIIKLLDDDFIMVREGRVSEIQLREVLRGVR